VEWEWWGAQSFYRAGPLGRVEQAERHPVFVRIAAWLEAATAVVR